MSPSRFWTLFLAFLASGLVARSAHATITFGTITGASFVDKTTTTNTTPIIYGGTAGADCTANAADAHSNCNSCSLLSANTVAACNQQRIYPSLILHIEFHSDTAVGSVEVEDSNGTLITQQNPQVTTSVNQTTYAELLWSNICVLNDNSSNTSCTTTVNPTIRIGISTDGTATFADSTQLTIKVVNPDPTGTGAADKEDACSTNPSNGICDFLIFPGDEKVYFKDPQQVGSFPNNQGLNFSAIRVFYSTVGFADVTPNSSFKDLTISTDASGYFILNKIIDGLTNQTPYFFRIGMLDPAQNVSFITSDAAIDAKTGCNHSDTAASYTGSYDCAYAAAPDEVVGMLSKDFNCFIATAAYGSLMAPKVVTFRRFRNRILLRRKWGIRFVKAYYHYGPYAARFIRHHEGARAAARIFLWPLWAFAWLSLKLGLLLSLVVSSASILAIGLLIYLPLRRRSTL